MAMVCIDKNSFRVIVNLKQKPACEASLALA